jgi:hypothetical protein
MGMVFVALWRGPTLSELLNRVRIDVANPEELAHKNSEIRVARLWVMRI